MRLPWPSRIARRPRQAMFVPCETWRGGTEGDVGEARASDAFEVVLGFRGERTGRCSSLGGVKQVCPLVARRDAFVVSFVCAVVNSHWLRPFLGFAVRLRLARFHPAYWLGDAPTGLATRGCTTEALCKGPCPAQ